MNYDDMILDCKGDCDDCNVTLECQYQTSSGEEKQKYLKLLQERDAMQNITETCAVEQTDDCPKSDDNGDFEQSDTVSTLEPNTEISTDDGKDANTTTSLTEKEVDDIFDSVFHLNRKENDNVCEDTYSDAYDVLNNEPKAEAAAEAKAEEPTTQTENEAEVITAADEKTVNEIFDEVFNLTKAVAEETAQAQTEAVNEPAETEETAEETQALETQTVNAAEVAVQSTNEEVPATEGEQTEEAAEETGGKVAFKLTPPENNEELMSLMCAKRARKLIYRPNETLISATFKVLGTDKKNEVGEKIKEVIDAEIKQGVKVGYLDKFDGLSSSEIKEEYENDIVYEYADQEFKKTGIIYDGKKIKVYIYDWDGKACHHVGYIDEKEAENFLPYFLDKESYSFDVCGIITGGKGKRVTKVGDTLKIVKEKGEPIGIDVDVAIIKRKD